MSQMNIQGHNVSVGGQQVIHQVEGESEGPDGEEEGNVCVGGTQVIHKYASPANEWDSEVNRHSQQKVWTTVCSVVKEHVLKHPVTIIIGSPGEGKTTTGYLVMDDLLKKRWHTFIPKKPQEYFSHKMVGQTIVLLNDIFGVFEYDEFCLKEWLQVFDDIRSHDIKSSDVNAAKTNSVKYIIVSRDYIWREAEYKLGKFINNIFQKVNIIDINSSVEAKLKLEDKLQIINAMTSKYGVELSKDVIERIIKVPSPHGFPHCAELMFTLQETRDDAEAFMREPLIFLKETIKQLCDDAVKRHVFCLLLKQGGDMLLYKTTEQLQDAGKGLFPDHMMGVVDVHTFQRTCKVLEGPYLQREEDRIKFSHPSVLHSVAVNLGCDYPELLIKHCDMSVLKDILRHGNEPDEKHVDVTDTILPTVVDRFAKELSQGSMKQVLSHVLLQWKEFVVNLLNCSEIPNDLPEQVDAATGESCLYLASSNKKNVFLEALLRRFRISKVNLVNAMFGCCEFGNSNGASYLLSSNQNNLSNVRNKGDETFLIAAARNRHTDVCRVVLTYQSIDWRNLHGDSAMHLAAEQGNTELIKLLIDRVKDVDQNNDKMETALHKALLGGHLETSKELLQKGADFSKTESMGLTALHCACYTGLSEIVEILVEKGCDLSAKNKRGSHAILKAAESGHTEVVEFLHNTGCSVHTSNNAGVTCLHLASQNGHIDTVKFLLRLGCDIDARSQVGYTPLMQAVIGGQLEVLKTLVDHGADINAMDIMGRTPFIISICVFCPDAALLLLHRGADTRLKVELSFPKCLECFQLEAPDERYRNVLLCLLQISKIMERFLPRTTMSALALSVMTGQKNIMVNILDQGEDPFVTIWGGNLLHYCCDNPNMVEVCVIGKRSRQPLDSAKGPTICILNHPCAEELIERGVDVNAFNSNGFAPLHLAAENGYVGMLKVLLDSNNCFINPRSHKDRSTPLHVAVKNDHTDAVKLLLRHECDVNSKDVAGRSPVHLACETGNTTVLKHLLSKGGDANIQDQKGNTPLHYAAWRGRLFCAMYLMNTANLLDMQNRYSFRAVDYAYTRCNILTGKVLEEHFPPLSRVRRCKLQILKVVCANPIVDFILNKPLKTICIILLVLSIIGLVLLL
ncbi:ankyrin-1-like [Haliotis cracherodii]|uniref:ankyrin-1-like n=1 Tax=Haliotis cracherodii TaxID=6455 RepID=UPI0039E758D7